MPPYEEEDAYASDTRNYSAGNNALLVQLASDVREMRRELKEQGKVVNELQVSMGVMQTQVLALQTSGRAERHVGNRDIWQALAIALLIVGAMSLLWLGRL